MNNICLVGRLTKEPEARYTSGNNTCVCNFTLAVDRKFKKDGQPEVDFIPIVSWGKTAEFSSKYFTKGLRVSVCGSLQTRSWEDTEKKKHFATEVIADQVGFADGKSNQVNDKPSPSSNQDEQPFEL